MEILVYTLLFATSITGLGFVIERGLALRWRKVVPPEVEAAVDACQRQEDVPALRRICEKHASPLSRLLVIAADHLDQPKADNTDAVQTRARHEIIRLERGLVVLEIIVGIAPLIVNVALTGFEFLVAVLQAYVFTILTCLYLHDAVHLH